MVSTGRLDDDEDIRRWLDLLIRCSMWPGISVMYLQKKIERKKKKKKKKSMDQGDNNSLEL